MQAIIESPVVRTETKELLLNQYNQQNSVQPPTEDIQNYRFAIAEGLLDPNTSFVDYMNQLDPSSPTARMQDYVFAITKGGLDPNTSFVEYQNKIAPPALTQEFRDAERLGYKGTIDDYIRLKNSEYTTDTGSPWPEAPTGFTYRRDDQNQIVLNEERLPELVAIPGSEQALEQEEAAMMLEQRKKRFASAEAREAASGRIVIDDVFRIFEKLDSGLLPDTGLGGQILQDYGGTDAHFIQQTLLTINARTGRDALSDMRFISPTGGALGQVTIGEHERLEKLYGALVQTIGESDFRKNLNRFVNEFARIVYGVDSLDKPENIRQEDWDAMNVRDKLDFKDLLRTRNPFDNTLD